MAQPDCILALDQGTTSSRAIVFAADGEIVSLSQQEFPQIYPQSGWVEHDPEVIWATTLTTARDALAKARRKGRRCAALGITNQRETTVVWDRESGAPIGNAIVWQDRRTAPRCRELEKTGAEADVARKTGLRLDPYFSATKLAWILDNTPDARGAAEAGKLAFGTVDSFLIWRLTRGQVHATDATNASRTALFDIRRNLWDEDLCGLFDVPLACLPEVKDCAADFGVADAHLLGEALPIRGVAGDQQAALVGQAAFTPGQVKSTYGTGAFMVLNTGDELLQSDNRLLGTIGYRLDGKTTYALEGSVLSAGSTVQWLRDGLGLIARSPEIEALARSVEDTGGVYLVPAFTGLGAPHWDPDARAALVGLTRASGRAEIARAGLDSAVYQTRDLLDAMRADGAEPSELRVDGGMAANVFFLQRLSDILDLTVVKPGVTETTAFGAACLARLGCGLFTSLDDISAVWREERRFTPGLDAERREADLAGWRAAVARVKADV